MAGARELYGLQLIDLEMEERRARLQEVEARLQGPEGLEMAHRAWREEEQRHFSLRTRLRDLELELGSVVAKLSSTERRLYGGQVANPRELSDMQREAEYLTRTKDRLETQMLEIMEEMDGCQAALERKKRALTEMEDAWQREKEELMLEQRQLTEALSNLVSQRKRQGARLGSRELALYEGLQAKRAGRAVALVKDGICQGCGVTLPISIARLASSEQELAYCSSCGRVLHAES